MVTLKTNFSLQFSCTFSFVLIRSFPFFSLFSGSFATLPRPSVPLPVSSNWGYAQHISMKINLHDL
jgi:hypothetical protein